MLILTAFRRKHSQVRPAPRAEPAACAMAAAIARKPGQYGFSSPRPSSAEGDQERVHGFGRDDLLLGKGPQESQVGGTHRAGEARE